MTRHSQGLKTQYYTVTSGLLVRYKATLLRGMSPECSSFVVLQSDPHSPLFSTLYLLPKDQTLKRATKQPRSHLVLPNTSHPDKRPNTKSTRLSVIPRIAQAPPDSCRTRRPCSVVTQEHSPKRQT